MTVLLATVLLVTVLPREAGARAPRADGDGGSVAVADRPEGEAGTSRPRRRRAPGASTTVLLTDAGPVAVDDETAAPVGEGAPRRRRRRRPASGDQGSASAV